MTGNMTGSMQPSSLPILVQVLSNWLTETALAEVVSVNSDAVNPALAGLSTLDRQWLEADLLADEQRARAFEITPTNVGKALEQRLYWLRSVHLELDRFCRTTLGWSTCPLELLWQLWLPLAIQIAEQHQLLGRTLIQGILGGQGTGKTTLTLILSQILNQMGRKTCRLSLDDLYKTCAERQRLQHIDPRFRWRGPPGTHDVTLGLRVLHQLRHATHPVALPRFDKSAWNGAGDRTEPEWVTGAEIVLFEGWFVGVRPIAPTVFDTAPPPIVTAADRAFAREINQRLLEYLSLWDQLDRLILLHPTDYRLSQQWRQQAERQMVASGKSGMTDREIHEFVEYFWQALHPDLFISPLIHDPAHVDLVIEINADHAPERVYCLSVPT